VLLLSACASNPNLVVVIPETNGHVGAVVVQAKDSRAVLNAGYAAAAPTAQASHPLPPGSMDEPKVRRIFGDALGALPAPPISESLFFERDSLDLTTESATVLQTFLETLKTRKAVEIVLTGHTDTQGASDYNDALSLQRAQSIREKLAPILLKYGVTAGSIAVAGRGERDPLVKTPDETDEPRNRRVEITVR
jgi:outer membrane protein OmpA-like peptidoglycan-associated protein